MNRTFATEDQRKTMLFQKWINYLKQLCFRFEGIEFDDIYEGMATVTDLSKSRMGLHLQDGRKIKHVSITPQIGLFSLHLDLMFIVLGLKDGKWWPIDVISIGSIISGKPEGAHITMNPMYVMNSPDSELVH